MQVYSIRCDFSDLIYLMHFTTSYWTSCNTHFSFIIQLSSNSPQLICNRFTFLSLETLNRHKFRDESAENCDCVYSIWLISIWLELCLFQTMVKLFQDHLCFRSHDVSSAWCLCFFTWAGITYVVLFIIHSFHGASKSSQSEFKQNKDLPKSKMTRLLEPPQIHAKSRICLCIH